MHVKPEMSLSKKYFDKIEKVLKIFSQFFINIYNVFTWNNSNHFKIEFFPVT